MGEASRITISLAPFVMIVLIIRLGIRNGMNKSRIRAELQKEALAKFSSGNELNEFLDSEARRRLFREPSDSRWGSKGRVVTLAVAAIIAVGGGTSYCRAAGCQEEWFFSSLLVPDICKSGGLGGVDVLS